MAKAPKEKPSEKEKLVDVGRQWPADKVERRAVIGVPGYEVSADGDVYSIDRILPDGRFWRGRRMKQKIAKGGYFVISLALGNGRYRKTGVHVLVCEAFHGVKPSDAHQVAHGDGDPKNNCKSNLRWVTSAENARDRDSHGRTAKPKGELHGCSKLTESAVISARKEKAKGASVGRLAAQYGVSVWTMFDALSGRTWSHV